MSNTCETIRLGLDSSKPGLRVQVVSNGQSIRATCAAIVATYYWALRRRAAGDSGKMNANGYVVEVWRVER